jgi:ligand-binding SRPBCC domain-containing protein
MSPLYRLDTRTLLPISLAEAWDFFSNPRNLARVTPAELGLEVTNEAELAERIYPGMIITYEVSPLPFFRSSWVTEITHVEERKLFVDEQRFGPYVLWHHKHLFELTQEGVIMRDLVHYKVPGAVFAPLIHRLVVRPKLEQIFQYRDQQTQKLFGAKLLA